MRQVHGTDPDTGLPRMGPGPDPEMNALNERLRELPGFREMREDMIREAASATGVTARLIRDYGMDPDRARRAVAIARDCELDNEPVPGGYVSIACTRQQDGSHEYALTPHTD